MLPVDAAAIRDGSGGTVGCNADFAPWRPVMLDNSPDPDEAAVRVLSGHLCRCTGRQNILTATLTGAMMLRGGARG